jgi:hypothetical protein
MLETIRHDPERQSLNFGLGLRLGTAVRENPRELGDLSDPPTVFLSV